MPPVPPPLPIKIFGTVVSSPPLPKIVPKTKKQPVYAQIEDLRSKLTKAKEKLASMRRKIAESGGNMNPIGAYEDVMKDVKNISKSFNPTYKKSYVGKDTDVTILGSSIDAYTREVVKLCCLLGLEYQHSYAKTILDEIKRRVKKPSAKYNVRTV